LAETETEEEKMLKRQSRERKELQAKIQGMKNAVPKNVKKRRKQLIEDVARLEAEMEERQEGVQQLKLEISKQVEVESLANGIEKLAFEDSEKPAQHSRLTKAQKRRGKEAALEKERENRIAEAEIENLSVVRHLENQKLGHLLAGRGLKIKQIPSDGHCMYRAIEDQLKERGHILTLAQLRSQTAQYMQSHVDDFLPFLINPNTGDI
uniref:ubiquitinyl hydrolase 1 n=1 Tax=Geotrypetes seraphini TaxID=260995 RepID=A0A6P8SC46_GEOSA